MALNNMTHLVGDYHSDSENEESPSRSKNTNNIVTNWTQCMDVSTGHPYYWNIVTKEVTWEIPNEYKEFLDQAKILHPKDLIKWILCYTDDNTPYYFNDLTREISWVKPKGFIEPAERKLTKEKNSKPEQIKNKFNLVPEYNSDDSDDELLSKQSENQHLFHSPGNSCNTTQIPLKSTFNSHEQSNNSDKLLLAKNSRSNSPQSSHSDHLMAKKTKPSFASIITGGRSPQNESEIQKYIGECLEMPSESSETSVDQPKEPEIVLSQKTFKRKRRIEFSASEVQTKRLNQNDDHSDKDEMTDNNMDAVPNENSTMVSMRKKYENYQKSETEFSKHTSTDTTHQSDNNNDNDDNNKLQKNQEIADQHCLLESKLKFLAQGRTDVSPVQMIQIQLQALQVAHIAEALHSDYFLEWMKNISNDLIKLENEAAPSGWKCLWNRDENQYCYENTTTAEIRWEYPEIELLPTATLDNNVLDNDEMDISNSPPPPNPEYHQTNEINEHLTPPPPKWSAEQTDFTKNEKPLDDELASFYSDIAKLEPSEIMINDDENSSDKPPTESNEPSSVSPVNNNEAPDCGGSDADADDKKKKKKKKVKKLEPWRSGNLETWINKWQKAQKELDG